MGKAKSADGRCTLCKSKWVSGHSRFEKDCPGCEAQYQPKEIKTWLRGRDKNTTRNEAASIIQAARWCGEVVQLDDGHCKKCEAEEAQMSNDGRCTICGSKWVSKWLKCKNMYDTARNLNVEPGEAKILVETANKYKLRGLYVTPEVIYFKNQLGKVSFPEAKACLDFVKQHVDVTLTDAKDCLDFARQFDGVTPKFTAKHALDCLAYSKKKKVSLYEAKNEIIDKKLRY